MILNINFSSATLTVGSLCLVSFITAESTFGLGIKHVADTLRITFAVA